jgi:drug/metabolite transporter superfamily protein YnfA
MKKYLPIAILISAFFIFKLGSFGIRLSDTNIYFYTGYKLLQGEVLYRDIFFTNFPFLTYLSAFYYLLTAGKLSLFFLTPMIEVSATSFVIYKIIKAKNSPLLAFISSFLYLFSFIVLSTSDHQTGVFFASFASVLSYYFYLNKKFVISGICLGLALLTKVYFLPILLALIVVLVLDKNRQSVFRFFIGLFITSFIIFLPTILFAFPDFVKQVFEYSLTRSPGIEKSGIIWFFITHDFLLFVLLLFSLLNIKKDKFLGLLSFFGIVFLLFYQDVYYLYLNLLVPFLALSFADFYMYLKRNFDLQKAIVLTVLVPLLLYSVISYTTGFRNLQKLNNFSEIVETIKKENPQALYGVNDITPALSHATKIPLLNGVVDTNANIYRKGILDARKMTGDAIGQKALIVAHGLDYPQQGVTEIVTDEIFDVEAVKKSCKLVGSFPVQTEGPQNRLNLMRCY